MSGTFAVKMVGRVGGDRERRFMERTDADAMADLIERAAKVTGGPMPDGMTPEALLVFMRHFYAHVSPVDLVDWTPADVYGAAVSDHALASVRPVGTAKVNVHNPSIDEHGWARGHTIVEVVTDDMPYLVDSVSMELSRQNRGIHLVLHPQMVVRRDVAGHLIEVLDTSDPAKAPEGSIV